MGFVNLCSDKKRVLRECYEHDDGGSECCGKCVVCDRNVVHRKLIYSFTNFLNGNMSDGLPTVSSLDSENDS